ncbi:MAG: hypothetical protein AB7F50_03505 [Fimbriimonadaceae bacterium]
MDEETGAKKPTLKARCDDLERRVGDLEAWRAEGIDAAAATPASEPEPVEEAAEQAQPSGEDLLPADQIRALLGESEGGEVKHTPAAPAAPEIEFLGDADVEAEADEPTWPPAIDPEILIDALVVLDTFQGRPVVFAAEPVDKARVSLVLEKCGIQVPVIGRPIEDIVPKLKELYASSV